MNMKKIILPIVVVLFTSTLYAGQRTLKQMKQIAASVLNDNTQQDLKKSSKSQLEVLKESDELAFIGYTNGGFVVVSKDDNNEEVLGYSKESMVNENLPNGLNWWVKAMNEVLSNTKSSNMKKSPRRAPAISIEPIEPLIKTQWGQESPYNDLLKFNLFGNTYTFATGCVATAMAQVIKYYEHPEKGIGQHSYNRTYISGTQEETITIETDFSAHTYDYSNMLDKYSSQSSQEQKNAVAILMKDCGVSVDMQYGEDFSGAYSSAIPDALKTYFGYDEGIKLERRSVKYDNGTIEERYTPEEWKAIIIKELQGNRPIIYSGSDDTEGGHEFIVDGLDENGYVHVNWGWDGDCDGYFDIDLLNPDEYSFSNQQDAVIGIKPAKCILASGTCGAQGDNVTWELDCDGVLTISGEGAMVDYSLLPDWYNYRNTISTINISDGVTTIGESAFSGCSNITSVEISNSVTSIGKSAFYGCNITQIDIPNSITEIGETAFWNCTNLNSINIPESVISIGAFAFSGCRALTSVSVDSNNKKYDSRNNCNAIIETSTNTLIAGCQNTIIPDDITRIGGAFDDCDNLTTIEIPSSITEIQLRAFMSCDQLTSITLPSSIKTIGQEAFYACDKITSVTCLATTPPEIANDAFGNVETSKIPLYVPATAYNDYKNAAVWRDFDIRKLGNTYTVTFLDNNDENIDEVEVTEGDDAPEPDIPEPDGYKFIGWDKPLTNIQSDLTVKAKYAKIFDSPNGQYIIKSNCE